MAFKFPARRHFGFYDVLWLPLLFGSLRSYTFEFENLIIVTYIDTKCLHYEIFFIKCGFLASFQTIQHQLVSGGSL